MASNKRIVHFIGIGGIGMSALARYFLAQKRTITGSDVSPSDITQKLKNEGVKVKIGHKKANLGPKTALVIYNQAIAPANPEIRAARRLGLKILSYSQALGELTRQYRTIAVAGAHGKSTTTALVSLILAKAGFDPTVIVGTLLKEFENKNFRFGRSRWLVLEADEFHASFLNYSPAFALITNIDREHLDYYKNFANVKKSFLKFIGNVKPNGILILNRDNKDLCALKKQIQKIAKRNNFKVRWYSCMTRHTDCKKLKKVLKIPGLHNLSNALGAYTLAKALGIKEKDILKALGSYYGAWRRLEFRGYLKAKSYKLKAPVYDDYAHHPTEIKATLQALKEKYPKAKIICVFQPHQAERLKLLFKDFVNAFNDADYLVLLPVYLVAGRDIATSKMRHATSKDLATVIKIKQLDKNVVYLSKPENLPKIIKSLVAVPYRQFTIVMMGAGNIVNYTKNLIK